MKKITILSAFMLIALSYWSCSNDLELIDEWRNIPVVYGLLSQSDDVHYIRVEKAYLDPSTSAFEIAQRPDSLYYDNSVSIEIEEVGTGERVTLERVDGTDVGFTREYGVFATQPNILYRFSDDAMSLQTNKEYRLIVTDGKSDKVLTEATTKIVGAFERIEGQPSNPIAWKSTGSVRVGWRNEDMLGEADQAGVFFDVRMKIKYKEQDPSDMSQFLDKELIWTVEKAIERPYSNNISGLAPRISVNISGKDFFEFLAANIEPSTSIIRVFRDIDIIIDAGGQEIYDYINIGQANTGITSAQSIPSYTNLSNGLGIFSSRNQVIFEGYNIDSEARDSLSDGSITGDLNFQ